MHACGRRWCSGSLRRCSHSPRHCTGCRPLSAFSTAPRHRRGGWQEESAHSFVHLSNCSSCRPAVPAASSPACHTASTSSKQPAYVFAGLAALCSRGELVIEAPSDGGAVIVCMLLHVTVLRQQSSWQSVNQKEKGFLAEQRQLGWGPGGSQRVVERPAIACICVPPPMLAVLQCSKAGPHRWQ